MTQKGLQKLASFLTKLPLTIFGQTGLQIGILFVLKELQFSRRVVKFKYTGKYVTQIVMSVVPRLWRRKSIVRMQVAYIWWKSKRHLS